LIEDTPYSKAVTNDFIDTAPGYHRTIKYSRIPELLQQLGNVVLIALLLMRECQALILDLNSSKLVLRLE